jgi:hypothetical protein
MLKVIILSPYAGEIRENIDYAKRCMLDSISRGEAPWASHLLYPQFLPDSDPGARLKGLACEAAWITSADLVAVYTDRGMSPGMIQTVKMLSEHKEIHIPIQMRSIQMACLVPGCETKVYGNICTNHWFSLPMSIRERWWDETKWGKLNPSEDLKQAVIKALEDAGNQNA